MQPTNSNQNQVISYLNLRTLIGVLGFALPFLLVTVDSLLRGSFHIEFSISDYYDNGAAGDLLVGILFVLGFFLVSYKGYNKTDDRVADLGFVAALGVALFPTTFCATCAIHYLHFVFALLLFGVFIVFSLLLFTKTEKGKKPMGRKKTRNRVYITCGIIMILCIAGIALSLQKFMNDISQRYSLVFWFEAIALAAFGFSWIVKGEVFWKDLKEENTSSSD